MGRAPCCEKVGLKRGPWTSAEDRRLIHYIQTHGEGGWRELPKAAGLLRCGKSCRLRWFNYLRPDLKRGNITEEEEKLIIKLHALLGNRWSLIASRLPGRTDNEIKNHWNAHLKKRLLNNAIITTNAMQNSHGGCANNYSRSSYNYMESLDKYGDHHHYIMDGNGSTKCGGEYNINQLSPLQQVPDLVQLNLISYDTNNNNNHNNPIPCNDARSGNVSPPEYSPSPAIVPLAPPDHPLPRVPSPPPAPHLPQLPSAAPSSPRVPHQPISGLQLAAPADQSVNGSGCYLLLHQSLSSSSSSTGHDRHHHHHDDIACTYGNAHHDVTTCGDYNSAQDYSAAHHDYHLHDLLLSADGLAYEYINCDHLLIDDHRPRDDHDHHNSTSNCSTSFSDTRMSASDPRLVIIHGDINYPIKFLSTPADCSTMSQSTLQSEDYQAFLMQEDMQIMICTSSSVININRYDISPDSPVHSTSDTANVEYDPYAELWGNYHS